MSAGAPSRYLAINAVALALGIAAYLAVDRFGPVADRVPGGAVLVCAAALLGTAFFGESVGAVTRWVRLGPPTIQPAAIVVPALVVAYSARQGFLMMQPRAPALEVARVSERRVFPWPGCDLTISGASVDLIRHSRG